jgi:tetratricopeptide (TPR) repeat protein
MPKMLKIVKFYLFYILKTASISVTCLLVLTITGCIKEQVSQPPPPAEEQVEAESVPEPDEPDPRTLASLQLTGQGRRLVEAGKSDQAIRVLEQAVSLNPENGQNYYYLAEAWLLKDVVSEAKKFNQLAEIHLKDSRQWMQRVIEQANQIVESEK